MSLRLLLVAEQMLLTSCTFTCCNTSAWGNMLWFRNHSAVVYCEDYCTHLLLLSVNNHHYWRLKTVTACSSDRLLRHVHCLTLLAAPPFCLCCGLQGAVVCCQFLIRRVVLLLSQHAALACCCTMLLSCQQLLHGELACDSLLLFLDAACACCYVFLLLLFALPCIFCLCMVLDHICGLIPLLAVSSSHHPQAMVALLFIDRARASDVH